MNKEAKRAALIRALKQIKPEMRDKLQSLKEGGKALDQPDWVWSALLGSFSTIGNSRGYDGLIANPANYNRVRFHELSKHDSANRLKVLEEVFSAAGIRWPNQKAERLEKNYQLIVQMGGVEEAKKKALNQVGTKGKIAFMLGFHGIGDKYARNIWMDICHSDFHNSIAIDGRVKDVTKALGYSFDNYAEHEMFYQKIAREADLQGWELDRLLYNFRDHFLRAIGAEGPNGPPAGKGCK